MEIMQQYENWSSRALEDPALNKELAEIQGKPEEIKDRFYCDLEFGTAGLRGVLGAGTNRMNIYTVRRATQGLADYLLTVKRPPRWPSLMTAASIPPCLLRRARRCWRQTASRPIFTGS